MEKPSRRKWSWMLLIRLLGIGLFVFILFRLDLKDVWKNLQHIHILYFCLAVIFQLIMLFIKGMRWHLLRTGGLYARGFTRNLGTFLESYAMGVFTPGRVGEFAKAGYEDLKQNKWKSMLRVLAERGFDLGIFIFIAGLAALIRTLVRMPMYIGWIACLTGLFLILFSFLLLGGNRLKTFFAGFLSEQSRIGKIILLDFNLKLNHVFGIFFLSLLSNAAIFISCFFLAVAVDLDISFLYVAGGVAVAGLLNLLPVTIMGLGTREASLLYLFSQVERVKVMAFSFMMFLTLQVAGGLLSLLFGQLLLYIKSDKTQNVRYTEK